MLSNSTSLHIGTQRPVDVDNAVTGYYRVRQVMTMTEWRTIGEHRVQLEPWIPFSNWKRALVQ